MSVKEINKKKVTFIICVNNEQYYEECLWYINKLIVPQNYMIDVIAVRQAESMCSAYNSAMDSSDAKYKIYLHQDVMIRNMHFLEELLQLFENDSEIGMIGMIGGTNMPETGVTYRAWNVGAVDCRDPDMAYFMEGAKDMPRENICVEAVDGLLIATQYDIPWREDVFTHFDFYDISQSFEMRKAGYKILVPYQEIPWVIHDSRFAKLEFYDGERRKCLKEYPEFFYAENGYEFTYDKQWNELSDLLGEQLKALIDSGCWKQVGEVIESYRKAGRKSSSLEEIGILYDIYQKEEKEGVCVGFFMECSGYNSIYEKYIRIRFLLRRIELGMPEKDYIELIHLIKKQAISSVALLEMVSRSIVDKKAVTQKLAEIFCKAGREQEEKHWKTIYEIVRQKSIPVTYRKKR